MADSAAINEANGERGHIAAAPPGPRQRAAPSKARHAFGFWIVAFSFLAVMALGTAPSPLYGLYRARDGFSPFTITLIYAAYAIGAVATLFLIGHTSDWYGRRRLLLAAIAFAALSAGLFLFWRAESGLFVARIFSGLAVGAIVASATAYLVELDAIARAHSSGRRPQLIALVANVGGLGAGALLAGLLAEYVRDPLVVPYVLLLGALGLGALGILAAPETRERQASVRYHPQRVAVPPAARRPYFAALAGAALAFGVFGLFAGLAGTLLRRTLGHPSLALAGAAVFVVFWSGIAAQVATLTWSARRGQILGVVLMLAGLAMVVGAAWLPTPSLALFLVGGAVVGAGGGAVFRATLSTVIAVSTAEHRAEALAGFFLAGYLGLSVPVVGLGIALEHTSPRVTLLGFAIAVGVAIVATTPLLVSRTSNVAPTARTR
jgi:MFS family permease